MSKIFRYDGGKSITVKSMSDFGFYGKYADYKDVGKYITEKGVDILPNFSVVPTPDEANKFTEYTYQGDTPQGDLTITYHKRYIGEHGGNEYYYYMDFRYEDEYVSQIGDMFSFLFDGTNKSYFNREKTSYILIKGVYPYAIPYTTVSPLKELNPSSGTAVLTYGENNPRPVNTCAVLYGDLYVNNELKKEGGFFWNTLGTRPLTPKTIDTESVSDCLSAIRTHNIFLAGEDYENQNRSEGPETPDNNSDDVGGPNKPDTILFEGLNLYEMTSTELIKLMKFMWSDNFYQSITKTLLSPIESIISLSIAPCKPTSSVENSHIILGNVLCDGGGGTDIVPEIVGKPIADNFRKFDYAELIVPSSWNMFIDYTQTIKIYLPYIGVQSLSVHDVVGARLRLSYIVDFITGSCTANLLCKKLFNSGTEEQYELNSNVYTWNGNILTNIPLSSTNFSNFWNNIINTGIGLVSSIATGNVLGAGSSLINGLTGGGASVSHSGSVNNVYGLMSVQKPYLYIETPNVQVPRNFERLNGYVSRLGGKLSDFSGYTEVESIELNVPNATEQEKRDIESLLKSGIFI